MKKTSLVFLLALGLSCSPPQMIVPIAPLSDFHVRSSQALVQITEILSNSTLPAQEQARLLDAFRLSFDEFNRQISGLVNQYMTITAARAQSRAENIVGVLLQVLGIGTTVLVGTRVISDVSPEQYREIGRQQLLAWRGQWAE